VLPELEKLPKVTGGLGKALENLADTGQQSLARVGAAFAPLVEKAIPLIEQLLTGVADVATRFTELPAPIQAAIGALVAMAAGIGPVLLAVGQIGGVITAAMPALTGLATFFGTTVAVLGGWAVAIAAATAALVAFGVWVYDNWDAITATLAQAWDGLTEMWTSVWGPLLPYIQAIWEGIKSATIGAWNAVADALSTVWNSIKSVASTVWGGIVSVFQTFLEWAAKIPGASKLMNLDDAWRSAQKASAEMEKAAKATTEVAKASDKAERPINALAGQLAKTATKAKEKTEAYEPLVNKSAELFALAKTLNSEYEKHAKALAEARIRAHDLTVELPDLTAEGEALAAAIAKANTEAGALSGYQIPNLTQALGTVEGAIKPIEDAYKQLGITSTYELEQQASEATTAYATIKNSGVASAQDIDRAWVAMEEKRIAAAKAAGQTIPAEQLAALEKMKTQLDTELPKQSTAWSDWSKQVSTIATDFSRDLSKLLFDGETSWAEKGKAALGSLGQSVSRMFIEPANKAIGDFIAGTLADLMGGKGFGGVLDRVKGIGDSITGIFGSGGAAGGSAAAARPPAAGGGGGGAAGAAAGWMGTVNMVSGVVSAVADVVSAIGTVRLEGTMNAVEHNTRYAMMYLGERADGGITTAALKTVEALHWVNGSLDDIRRRMAEAIEPPLAASRATLEHVARTLDVLSDPLTWGSAATRAIEQTINNISGQLFDLRSTAALIRSDMMTAGRNWTVTFYGDPIARLVGEQIMAELQAQGARIG
jgi:hypothetical protein